MKRSVGLVCLAILGIAFIAGSFLRTRPALIWNSTASAPVGLWRILNHAPVKGDWVAVRPAEDVLESIRTAGLELGDQLLIKTIAGSAGDHVCRDNGNISINGTRVATAMSHSSLGVPLPGWNGCRLLRETEVFLLGESDASFDGRYFGPTEMSTVIAPVDLIFGLSRNP